MTDTEITRIRVDDYEVGIVGLKTAIEKALSSCSGKVDTEICSELLESVSKQNYIPSSAREKYAEALFHEFRKMRGDSVDETQKNSLDIKIFGPGCYQCDTLEKTVMKILSELKCAASLEHITDIKEIARAGVFSTPALVINGKVVSRSLALSENKIRQLVKDYLK